MSNKAHLLPISAVEQEVGISKDVLRKWEARYGFPVPDRNKRDERVYSSDQVSRLRLIKRLIDSGIRPSKIVPESAGNLMALAKQIQVRISGPKESKSEAVLLGYLRTHNLLGLRQRLQRLLLEQGLYKFILDTVAPITYAVGEAWSRSELEVYEEHLFSEIIQDILRNAVDTLSHDTVGQPRILLTTTPDEAHTIGIQMASGLFALEGAYCIFLGAQTPVDDIASAVQAHRAEVVALSFSDSYPQRRIAPVLTELRDLVPQQVAIWAGGDGISRLDKSPKGTTIILALEAIREVFLEWRGARAA